MKKIAICTFHPQDSIPPRIRMEAALLNGEGYEVDIIYAPYAKSAMGALQKFMFYITLSYFRWDLIAKYRYRLKGYDVVIIYDLYLLPLSLFLSGSNKKIIYETLDNNIELTFYNLKKSYPILTPLQGLVIHGLTYFEKWCIRKNIHVLIVNSEYLRDYFTDTKSAIINFYASPFEEMQTSEPFPVGKKPALLYLGIFSEEKGAKDVLQLADQLDIELFVFGEAKYIPIEGLPKRVHQKNRLPLDVLYKELLRLAAQYHFIGTSLIRPANKSYANQDANKEVDYLSLGIPFIGNDRRTTIDKIKAGCGVLSTDQNGIAQLTTNLDVYQTYRHRCLAYYNDHFSISRFKATLLDAIGRA